MCATLYIYDLFSFVFIMKEKHTEVAFYQYKLNEGVSRNEPP